VDPNRISAIRKGREDKMAQKKLHYGWIVIFMGLLTTIAAHGFGRMAYTIILPAMKDGLKFDYTQLGLLGTGNFIGYLTMAIIGGFIAARFGTRIVITFALILMGISMILTGLAESFGFAFSMRLLTGLGNGAAFVPAMALGSAWFSANRPRIGLVFRKSQGICHRNRFRRNWRRHFNIRPGGSTDFNGFRSGRLAFFMVYFGRCGAGHCRYRVFIYPQPAGRKRVDSGGKR